MSSWLFYFFCGLFFLLSGSAVVNGATLKADGTLRFYVTHLDSFHEVTYLRDGQWQKNAEQELQKILRSHRDHQQMPLDRKLIELLDHLQDHFEVDVVEVISCYRSEKYNNQLKASGHGVALDSFHTKGQACDIHFDEINEKDLRDYAIKLKKGGVGYYGKKLFVHIDTGPVRVWQAGHFAEQTNVGIFNTKSPIEIKSHKFYYNDQSLISFKTRHLPKDFKSHLMLQKFYRGQWVDFLHLEKAPLISQEAVKISAAWLKKLKPQVYGKFRIQYQHNKMWQHSNEFYIKKGLSNAKS